MARRGPPPLPTRLKLIAGNPGKRRLNAAEPTPAAERPELPPALKLPATRAAQLARGEWDRTVGELVDLGVLTRIDRAVLEAFVVNYGIWAAAIEHVLAVGAMVKAPQSGVPMQNPNVAIAKNAMKLWMAAAAELGIGPASRSRVSRVEPSKEDDEDLLG